MKFAFGTDEVQPGYTQVASHVEYDAMLGYGFLRIAEMPNQTSAFAVAVEEGELCRDNPLR